MMPAVRPSTRPFRALLRMAAGLLLAAAAPVTALAAATCDLPAWPKWDVFKQHYVQKDGRVLDASTPKQHSSSEGQSYGMFFALVAGDRETFDRLWQWSVDNLAAGDMTQRLPAWYWGLRDDGSWGVLDTNSASDADLWFAYALLEAARVWHHPEYARQARALMALIEEREVVEFQGFGTMLLPGVEGFVQPRQWRANPSYLPVSLLRRLQAESPEGSWGRIADNTLRLVQQSGPLGYAADWVAYDVAEDGKGKFGPDPAKGAVGSYDAIRTYMWAGMIASDDPLAKPMLQALKGLAQATEKTGAPPEKVDVYTGEVSGTGPFGFSAALLPYLKASGQEALLRSQTERALTGWDASLTPERVEQQQPPYYGYVLSMFSTSWMDGRYRFLRTGHIQLQWEKLCPHVVTR